MGKKVADEKDVGLGTNHLKARVSDVDSVKAWFRRIRSGGAVAAEEVRKDVFPCSCLAVVALIDLSPTKNEEER